MFLYIVLFIINSGIAIYWRAWAATASSEIRWQPLELHVLDLKRFFVCLIRQIGQSCMGIASSTINLASNWPRHMQTPSCATDDRVLALHLHMYPYSLA